MARARSASAKMTFGDFPPSSREMRVIVSAAAFMISMPVVVSPVNAIFPTPGSRTSAMPAIAPGPVITFSTPAGTPASRAIAPRASAVSGVALLGFSTAVLPTASAGATFQEAIISGKFQGTISPTTPIGSRSVKSRPRSVTGIVSPNHFVAAPA